MKHYIEGLLPITHENQNYLIKEYNLGYEIGAWYPVPVEIRELKTTTRRKR